MKDSKHVPEPSFTSGNSKILKYFRYEHLPERLQAISKPFHDLAYFIEATHTEDFAERAVALRKLLEAKDAAVRAALN